MVLMIPSKGREGGVGLGQTIKQSPCHEFVTFLRADSYHACAMFIYQLLPPSFHCYVRATDTDSTPHIVVITILTILLSRPINLVN